ncbi:MAG: TrbI/VirB10 family protein [Rickettsiales bacterium]|jgi:hypothetical protein|nr:TrbI/VirB10 family protein [Rickettsiales bacterium]
MAGGKMIANIIHLVRQQKQIATAIGVIVTIPIILVIKGSDPETRQIPEQNYIIEDQFFNTTPRLEQRDRVIVIYKDNGLYKQIEQLDEKGNVLKSDRTYEEAKGLIRRKGGQVLRSGERLQNGDIMDEEIFYKEGIPYRRQKVYKDGEWIDVEEPLGGEEYSYDDLEAGIDTRADVEGEYYDGQIVSEKLIIDKNGDVKRLYKIYRNGEGVVEEIEDVETLTEGQLLDEDIRNEGGIKKRISRYLRNGKVVEEQEILSSGKSFFNYIDYTPNKLTSAEQQIISDIKKNRTGFGEVKIISDDGTDYNIINSQENYLDQDESITEASYPVDLTRTITMDRFIPAVLYTEINSEILSKKVIAVIESDVVGSHGRKILIPRGSKAIGSFQSVDGMGATRIGIGWYRIITPEGVNIKLESELADAEGASGVQGNIDHRYGDRYGAALLFSSISALAQLSVDVDNDQGVAAADAFTSELGSLTTEILRETLNLVPTISIPKGTRINISPLQDIWFKKVKGKAIQVSTVKY